MRAIRLTSAAALGLAALSFTTPAATAVDGKAPVVSGTATPSTIAPGGQITLAVTGCNGDAIASSAVFDPTRIPMGGTATATVDWDARRGAVYLVTYACNGETDTSDLTITGGSSPTASPTSMPTATATTMPTGMTTTPAGPARGGVGGSIGGMNAGEIAAGATLVVAAVGGAVFVLRRRRSSTGNRQH
ncbi:hypothetical protein [Streptomyces enissocaesilis]|uniref:Lipoprotein n=1 Tax=Streptomyces enissocaesilis TaxID=332589 RepID=A0ABN3WSW4_9ACTN